MLENTPLIKFKRNYIRDLSGIFSVSSLVKISMISLISSLSLKLYFLIIHLVFDRNIFGSYTIKRTWLVSSKRYEFYVFVARTISHLFAALTGLVRYWSCHSNKKFISSHHHVISSIYWSIVSANNTYWHSTWSNWCTLWTYFGQMGSTGVSSSRS